MKNYLKIWSVYNNKMKLSTTVLLLNVLASLVTTNAFNIVLPATMSLRTTSRSLYHMRSEMDRRDICKLPAKSASIMASIASFGAFLNTAHAAHAVADDTKGLCTKYNRTEKHLDEYTKLESGLLYKDIVVGKGQEANDGDAVSINMVGYIFETDTYKSIPSYQSTIRAGVSENQKFMKGLDEGIKTMKRGGERVLVIPPYLAYNYTIVSDKNPNKPIIPRGSSLVCYVALK
jgi:FKBP-type peptidyl-prolyl cis-trans isomerase